MLPAVSGVAEAHQSFGSPVDILMWFCFPSTELGNTISSLFGGGGPTPESGENLTDSVQVSPR